MLQSDAEVMLNAHHGGILSSGEGFFVVRIGARESGDESGMKRLVLVLLAATLLDCSAGGRVPRVEPIERPARRLPLEVQWVRNSGEYRAICLQTFQIAARQLESLVEDRAPGSWAVALDGDDTVLNNSLYQKELSEVGRTYDEESWAAWLERREATPVPGVKTFIARAIELGGKIAIVTNRLDEHCLDTEENLRGQSIPFDILLCRRDERDKNARWRLIEEGEAAPELPPLEIVMWFGDNIHYDFPGIDEELRFAAEDLYAGVGVRYFVLPNPMYGSWADNWEE
jgi:5'-nucleotidase (lipoprotein e(P4) family)